MQLVDTPEWITALPQHARRRVSPGRCSWPRNFRVVLSFHPKIVLNTAVSRVARRGVVAQTRAAALQEVADQLDSLRGAINGLSRVAEAIAAVLAKERSKALTVAEACYRSKRAGSRL
jgi:hypothetical protein